MMQPINLVIGTAWIVAGLVCVGLSIPLIANRVGPNPLYGVRFPQAFRSADAWFAINRFGGKRLALWAVPQIIWGIAAYFVPMQGSPALTLLLGVAPILFIVLPALESWRFARRYSDTDSQLE